MRVVGREIQSRSYRKRPVEAHKPQDLDLVRQFTRKAKPEPDESVDLGGSDFARDFDRLLQQEDLYEVFFEFRVPARRARA